MSIFEKKAKKNRSIGHQNQNNSTSKSQEKLILFFGVILITLFGLSAGTQYFAYQAKYAVGLGFSIGKFYMPWDILIWYSKWYQIYPSPLSVALSISLIIMAIGLALLHRWIVIRKNTNKANVILHGSARWADKEDIEKAGLLGNPGNETGGVIVGGWEDKKGQLHYLKHFGSEHVLTVAPTRSGKGVGLIIPTLLTWVSSAVIMDLKGELWALTAGWRKFVGNKVIRFEPAASNGSACWNPLDEIRIGTDYEVGDTQNIATMIVDPDGKGLKSHWDKTAFSLLTGVILMALYKARKNGQTASLNDVDRMLANPDQPVSDLWVEMAKQSKLYTSDGNDHDVISSTGQDMLDRPEEEAGSVLSTAKSFLALYRDPAIARNISHSNFCIKDLMNHDSPVSLYIITEPSDKTRLRPLTRILISMIFRILAGKMKFEHGRPKPTYKHRLLFMGDEIASQGKLEPLQDSLASLAGNGILCYLIFQDITQIKSRELGYGVDESISSNTHIQNAYPPNRAETAEYLSKLTGTTTVIKEQITTSGKRLSTWLGQVSKTTQEVQRPLLTVDECLRMLGAEKENSLIIKGGHMLIFVAGYPAIYGQQVLYFQDPYFLERSKVPAPTESDKLKQPTEFDHF